MPPFRIKRPMCRSMATRALRLFAWHAQMYKYVASLRAKMSTFGCLLPLVSSLAPRHCPSRCVSFSGRHLASSSWACWPLACPSLTRRGSSRTSTSGQSSRMARSVPPTTRTLASTLQSIPSTPTNLMLQRSRTRADGTPNMCHGGGKFTVAQPSPLRAWRR